MKRFIRHVQLALAVAFTTAVGVFAFQAQQQQADPPRPEFKGKVVSVADGDTITVLHDNVQHRIRLEGIDCPESHQAFGTKAKQAIADKVFGKEVTIKWKSRDKYKRILGEVYLGDRHVNLEMVQEGWAWHYVQYSKDPALAKAEKEARAAKAGLWADPNPIPPWEFRNGKAGAAALAEEQAKGIELAKTTVYGTNSGKKYHLAGCRYLAKSMVQMTLAEATKKYGTEGACSVCKPPVLKVNAEAPPPTKQEVPVEKEPSPTTNLNYPISREKWDCKLLEKAYPLKLTAAASAKIDKGRVFKLTFEFVEDDKDEKVQKVKGKLAGKFYFFDGENVFLSAVDISAVEGFLDAKKGYAFRVVVAVDEDTFTNARKVEVREK